MTLGFWFSLAVCLLSLVAVLIDHGEARRSIKSAEGAERGKLIAKLALLWGIPAFALLALLVTTSEAIQSKKGLAETTTRLQDAEEEAKAATKLAAKADSASRPRRITKKQGNSLVRLLSVVTDKPRIKICAGMFDSESMVYGGDLKKVFEAAGFDVAFPTRFEDDGFFLIEPPGLHVVVKYLSDENNKEKEILKCFVDSGVDIQIIESEVKDQGKWVEIAVGQK